MNPVFYSDFEQRRPPGIWHSLNRLLFGAIIIATIIASGIIFIPLLKERAQVSTRITELQAEIAKQKTIYTRRSREAELLRNDPEYIELIARDRLGVMKAGETILRLETVRTETAPKVLKAVPAGG